MHPNGPTTGCSLDSYRINALRVLVYSTVGLSVFSGILVATTRVKLDRDKAVSAAHARLAVSLANAQTLQQE